MNPLTFLVQLFMLAGLTLSVVALVVFVSGIRHLRTHRRGRATLAGSYLLGLCLGGWLAWQLIPPPGWKFSFWMTVQASIDAATYTHTVEHAAENILVGVILFGVIGGIVFASAEAIAARVAARVKHA
jgi:hypothetical protein